MLCPDVGDTGRKDEEATNDDPDCPPKNNKDDKWCKKEQDRLNSNRIIFATLDGAESLVAQRNFGRIKREFNISVNIHNTVCPKHQVEPL